MKHYLFIVALLAAMATSAVGRPQLHTDSIGWINPSSIFCEMTSDHTCTVKKSPDGATATTFTAQQSNQSKYQVLAGTELVVLNQGRDNEPSVNEDKNEYVFHKRVEVAIVIPADWGNDGDLHLLKPCHLSYQGSQSPKVVSLACMK